LNRTTISKSIYKCRLPYAIAPGGTMPGETVKHGEGRNLDRAKASRKEGIKKGATVTLHLYSTKYKERQMKQTINEIYLVEI